MKTSYDPTPLLVKCLSAGFNAELKAGNYYCAKQCPLDDSFYFINGMKDANGWPIQFGKHNFITVS